jgi:hypothetical protein
MATAEERKAAKAAREEAAEQAEQAAAEAPEPSPVSELEALQDAPDHYTAKRDLFIAGVPAFRVGDQVPAYHVARYGWAHDVEEPEGEG